ncbi:MAG: hypothetical protein ACRENB_05920 [Gemmatimonadales bacterium]
MSRRGVALFLAMLVLGVISATVATAFELALAEHRSGAAMISGAEARGAAEAAMAEAANGWATSLRPAGTGITNTVWTGQLSSVIRADLQVAGTEGPYLVLVGRGYRTAADGRVLAEAELRGVAIPDTLPGDSLDYPRSPPRFRWRRPP